MEITRDCQNFKRTLLPDETVVWSGRSQKTPLLAPEVKAGLLVRWIACAVIFAALIVLYTVFANLAGTEFNALVVLVLVVAFGCIALVPVKDWNTIQKKAYYYVTNKRVILVSGSTVYALNRNGINTKTVHAEEGAVHVLFGSCVDIAAKKYRRFTALPEAGDNDSGFVFYAVQEGKSELENLLSHS